MPEMTVTIGEKTYPFKKMNITIFEEHLEFLKKNAGRATGAGVSPVEGLDGILEMTQIIFKCIRRAKPDVTLAELKEDLDQDTIGEAFGTVMRGGSFVPVGEGKPAAE